jgi:hypothetical protein
MLLERPDLLSPCNSVCFLVTLSYDHLHTPHRLPGPPPAGVQFDQNDLSVRLGDIPLMEAGQPLPFDNAVRQQAAGCPQNPD